MTALIWSGTVCGALIAVGTVLRWIWRRTMRASTWVAAVVRLPGEVDRLASSVTDLTEAVQALACTIHTNIEEETHVVYSL